MDFNSLANVKIEELPEVKLMPRGTYIWSVDKIPSMDPSKSGYGTNVAFRLKCVRAIDNFEDPIALEEFGNPASEVRTVNFYVPDRAKEDEDQDKFERNLKMAMRNLVEFLSNTLKVEGGETVVEKISLAVNHQCLGQIKHKPHFQNPKRMVDNLDSGDCAPIE